MEYLSIKYTYWITEMENNIVLKSLIEILSLLNLLDRVR